MRTLAGKTIECIGQEVHLQGWIHSRRDHGKIMFLDLRDRTGLVQMVSDKQTADVKNEDVVEVIGLVKKRPDGMVNKNIATGTVEIEVKSITILGKAKELPFPIDTEGLDINEDIRMKYRYLDLRRPRLQRNIRMRSKIVDRIRQFLFSRDFLEIETPLLTKSTPEGSRDFLVPSRLQPGKFYALPQSPQQYKQLLMVAGFERYFQLARCLRDEDLRADRGFEHTQVDLEMSFVTREDVMHILEEMIITVFEAMGATIKQKPFPVYTYQDAMKKFGSDKFDLRTEKEKQDGVKAFAWVIDFPFFEKDKENNWTFTHNPFSNPKDEYINDLLEGNNLKDILTTQYDLVCNGFEVGGGSIRSHRPEILQRVFEIIGYKKDQIQEQFGHMLEALTLGAPPHGGCAFGVERLMMILTGEQYLREVVAFPQTAGGKTSVMEAPGPVSDMQLKELGISVQGSRNGDGVYDQIEATLKNSHIPFDVYEHEPVHTSEEAAKVRKTNPHEGAKALVLYADGKPIMIIISGDMKVDMREFKHLYDIRDLRMATPEEVIRLTGVAVGAVPPFGHLFGLPLYMDQSVRTNEYVAFNAGLHTKSIRMKETDWEIVAKPVSGEFSKKS
jgi:aspartyl-tRNA synthetase